MLYTMYHMAAQKTCATSQESVFWKFCLDKFYMFVSSVFSVMKCVYVCYVTLRGTKWRQRQQEHLKYNLGFSNKLLAPQSVLTAARCMCLSVCLCVWLRALSREGKWREGYRRPTDGKEEQQTHWQKKMWEEVGESVWFRFQESSTIPEAANNIHSA